MSRTKARKRNYDFPEERVELRQGKGVTGQIFRQHFLVKILILDRCLPTYIHKNYHFYATFLLNYKICSGVEDFRDMTYRTFIKRLEHFTSNIPYPRIQSTRGQLIPGIPETRIATRLLAPRKLPVKTSYTPKRRKQTHINRTLLPTDLCAFSHRKRLD